MFSPTTGIISQLDFLKKISEANLSTVTTNKKITYYNVPAAFDIETSSFYMGDEKNSCMYIWQFGILNWVTVGRTWEEYELFTRLVAQVLGLNETLLLPVYVHNFAYEFQFIRKRFSWTKLFFLDERKPVYGITGGIEYRCSLKLSSKSLKNVGKDLQHYPVEKLSGSLDYNLIRTSETPLTSEELHYCENDIRVVLAYIQEKIEQDGDVTRIPLTNTGYVRRFCKNNCYTNYSKYREIMKELTIDAVEYSQLKQAFCGGFTHASAKYFGKTLEHVGSFDFTSSYPAVMLSEKFPMSKSRVISGHISTDELNDYLAHNCCILAVTYEGLVPKVTYDHPISYSRTVQSTGVVTDNGRVVSALSLSLLCTEQDFLIYNKFYEYDDLTIHSIRVYEKGYLPKPFIQAVLQLYKGKTKLKGVEGEEVNYMILKNMLNSAYGMMVTDPVREIIEYKNDEFESTKPAIADAIETYNNSKNRFLFYPWGVWVTAYARRNLFTGILACGNDYIYSDTDSIKILNPDSHMDYIEDYNKKITEKLRRAAEFHKIDPAEFSPLNEKGEPKPIGVWDYEGYYDRFKTLGAKRYLTERDGIISVTVAGLDKCEGAAYLRELGGDPFVHFRDGLRVPPEKSGRLTHTYIDERISGQVTDYLGHPGLFDELSSIHMEPSDYTLTISEDYDYYIKTILGIKEDSF